MMCLSDSREPPATTNQSPTAEFTHHDVVVAVRNMKRRLHILVAASLLLVSATRAWMPERPQSQSTTSALTAKKFSQPAFEAPRQYGSDGKIASLYEERIKTAGRVGTKRYVNPSKVFVGNLPFDVDEIGLRDWLASNMGQPHALLLNECKVVQDWKTGRSKGYGFAVFTEPIYATVCIEKCNGQDFGGRAVTVNQGRKKLETIYKKKKKNTSKDADDVVIAEAIEELDPEQIAMFKNLDPDLLPDTILNDNELDDSTLFEEFDNDDDIDGFWEGDEDDVELDPSAVMNREQRRKAARGQKKKKLPHSGFGPAPE